jgi:vacuolar-type H+-ATPase subunit I/STV1
MVYNSYREDTGTSASQGLQFVASPWHVGQYACDLSKYLSKEEAADVPVGVNLFADGALTSAQGRIRFQKTPQVAPAELAKRLDVAVRATLSQIKEVHHPEAYVEHVENELKSWLPAFVTPPAEPSVRFEAAVRQAVKSCDENRRNHERSERQQTMTALQRAEEQAREAMDQVRVLTEHIKELEVEARRSQVRHQTELAALRAQIQKAKSDSGKPAEWACTVCTFVNPADNAKCAMCATARQTIKDKDAEWKHN